MIVSSHLGSRSSFVTADIASAVTKFTPWSGVCIIRTFGSSIDASLHASCCHRRHICLSKNDSAATLDLRDHKGVIGGDQVLKSWRSGSHCHALDLVAVFYRTWYAFFQDSSMLVNILRSLLLHVLFSMNSNTLLIYFHASSFLL